MPASGPVNEPKLHPAAAMEDQEMLSLDEGAKIVLGTPPFSSPDPQTDALKMLPLSDGTSAYEAAQEAADARKAAAGGDYESMKKDELKALAEERDIDVSDMKVAEMRAALREDDASDMKAADFKAQVDAAEDQDALDAAAELYEGSGKSYASVEAAIEKKQDEINDAGNGS